MIITYINNKKYSKIKIIQNIILQGEFIGVMGPVGCGKSSFLSVILAELSKKQGSIGLQEIENGFGYVSQQPWLQRGSIRDNILFGKPYDENKYRTILDACGLTVDLLLFPANDLTGVGEGGMTLSGGQKARVALARALYQDKSFYLLDDIFSAVDVKVGKHIFQRCIMGLLRNKTVVLCTHHIQYLIHADRIFVMKDGQIHQQGKPNAVLSDVDDVIPIDIELGNSLNSIGEDFASSSIKSEPSNDNDSVLNEEARETGTVQFSIYKSYWSAVGNFLGICVILSIVLMQTSRNMIDWWLSFWVTNSAGNRTNLTVQSGLEGYSNAGGNCQEFFLLTLLLIFLYCYYLYIIIIYVLLFIYYYYCLFIIIYIHYLYIFLEGNQINTIEDIAHITHPYLSRISNFMLDALQMDSIKYYMMVYGILAGVNSIFTLFRAFLFAYGGITAASKIHKTLLKSIVNVSEKY